MDNIEISKSRVLRDVEILKILGSRGFGDFGYPVQGYRDLNPGIPGILVVQISICYLGLIQLVCLVQLTRLIQLTRSTTADTKCNGITNENKD